MAKQAVRQISVFIESKGADNSLKSLTNESRKLSNELALMDKNAKEYPQTLKKLQTVNGYINEHRKALKGIEQGWGLTKAGLAQYIGVAAGAFAVDRIISFGKELLNQADAQLKADAQIKAAIRSTGGVAGKSLQELKTQAEELQKVTLFGDEQTEGAQALLLTFKSIRGEIFDQTIPLVQDLATAFKQDLSSSAVQVGKALEDPIKGVTALRRVGITFSEDQRAMIKSLVETGDVAAAQTIILKELETQVGGSARAAAQAGAGPLQVLTNQLGEIEEAAGGVVVDLVKDLAPALNDVTSAVLDFLTVPVSETLEKERQAFNGLSLSILNADEGTKERTEGIKNLQKEYPQFLANIDAEKATNEQLKPILDKINQSYIIRIALQKEQEKIQPLIEKAGEQENKLANARTEYNRQLARGAELSGVNLQAIQSEAEQAQAVITALQKSAQFQEGVGFSKPLNEQAEILSRIQATSSQIDASNIRQKFATDQVTEAEKKRQEVIAQVAKTYGDAAIAAAAGFSGKEENEDPDPPGGKNTVKEAERLAKDLEALIERTTAARLDLISKAQDDELAATIRGIEKRYDAEIAKALELEKKGVAEATAQRIALEKLKNEEIGLAVEADISKAIEIASKQAKEEAEARLKARKEVEDKDNKERADALEEIKTFTQENLLTEQELELAQLEEHYNKLLELANENGADTAAITAAYEKAKAAAVKDSTEQRLQYEKDLADAQTELEKVKGEALIQSAAILGSFLDETSALGKALFLFEKAAAAVSVVLSLQKEKAAIFAAARLGTIFDPTGIAAAALAAPQVIAANIRAGINLATIAATAIKGVVKQKASGGYLSVTGEDDGRTYNASVIPTPYTGLLPPHPVLFQSHATGAPVLASERGQEYFVSSDALRNPYVANLTRMIDNIAGPGRRGVQQFADGGDNPPAQAPGPAPDAGVDMAVMRDLAASINTLNSLLASGIVAVIPDRTLTAIPERLGKINKASGGYYG